jgi:cell wall-associated NlpC family hydrolase
MSFLDDLLKMLTQPAQTPGAISGVPPLAPSVSIPLGTGYSAAGDEYTARQKIVQFMRSQLGKPYKLGIEIPSKKETWATCWDCSELVEAAYRLAGHPIADGARFQFATTQPIRVPKPADLFFLWSDKLNYIGHVMAATGCGTVLHAVGGRGVVEDPVSMWEHHIRGRGWRRHVDFARGPEERV